MREDRWVVLVSYQRESDALAMMNRLDTLDIPCNLRNYYTSRMFGMLANVGGYIVEVPESSREQVQGLLASGELVLPDESVEWTSRLSGWGSRLPLPAGWGIERRLGVVLLVVFLVLSLVCLVFYCFCQLWC